MNNEIINETDYYSVKYDEIIGYFGEEKIKARFAFIYDKMKEYISDRKLESEIIIDEDILSQMVMDYFADIYRLKKFHGIERINKSKILSYEIYWLLRRKPMQKIHNKGKVELSFVNEGFLTTLVANEFLQPNESAPLNDDQEKEFIGFLKHINYYLKYRSVDKQWLETILCSYKVGQMIGNYSLGLQ